jgi:hypothetical protein
MTIDNRKASIMRRTTTAALLVTASIAAIGCGESDPPPTILNTEKVERAIEQSSLDQRRKRVHVSCPSGVHQKKGLVFSCVTSAKRGSTRFVVTQLDEDGRVHYEAP